MSAIRFYADEGIVAPTGLSEGGFRQYDVQAIARLELVRTLRDLGVGLDEIRRVLGAEATLHDVAAAHLRLVEDELRQFRARRAVLRTIVRQHTAAEQVSLMHKLLSMSDDDRDLLITEFWDFVTDDLDVYPGYVERLHSLRPHLPEEPSTEQLEAWIELAELVRDEGFRTALRDFFRHAFGSEKARLMTSPEVVARVERHRKLLLEALASQRAGMAADSPQARDIAERVAADRADLIAAVTGNRGPGADEVRRRIAEYERDGEPPQWLAKAAGLKMLRRYHVLVATISGTPKPDPRQLAAMREWMATALR